MLNVGDVYFNAGGKPNIANPQIAKNKKDARRWLVAKVLIRDVLAYNITCADLSNYMGYGVLCVKYYRRSFDDGLYRYPESESSRLTQKYLK